MTPFEVRKSRIEATYGNADDSILKSNDHGEGSRGGKIIRHTRTGKPIYDLHGHHSHQNFTKEDHRDARGFNATISAKMYNKKKTSGLNDIETTDWHLAAGRLADHTKSMYPGGWDDRNNLTSIEDRADFHSHENTKSSDDHIKAYNKNPSKFIPKVKLETYHNTFSSAVQNARAVAESQGYEVDEDDWANQITFGRGKPSVGDTTRATIGLTKDGKASKKGLSIQVYGMQNKYELNSYIN